MERDFMGLHSKEPVAIDKEELKEGGNDAVARNSRMPWGALSHKVSALPQFMSFKSAPEEKPKKFTLDTHNMTSAFHHPVASPDAVDSGNRSSSGFMQKNLSFNGQSTHVGVSTYFSQPINGNGMFATLGHEFGTFPLPNHSASVAMGNPFFKVQGAASVKQHVFGGLPVTTSNFVAPVSGPFVGTYASRNNAKVTNGSEQLTIFYRGAVNVYENISAEKAQAIMFLAGSSSSVTPAPTILGSQVQAPVVSKPEPCSDLSSPISVTSHPNAQSGSGSSNIDELMASKIAGGLATPSNQAQPDAKTITSSAAALFPAAVPQARKASLARFLEKRKERVSNAGPYAFCKRSAEITSGNDQAGAGNRLSWLGQQKNEIAGATLTTKLEI